MEKTFDLICEMDHSFDRKIAWNGESVPDIVIMPGNIFLCKVGRYASPGDRYWYRIADICDLSQS